MSTRTKPVRTEVQRLISARPFRAFVITLESGDRVPIEHPENIAFDPSEEGESGEFYVISGKLRVFSMFDAVSNVSLLDVEGAAAAG